VSAGMLPLLLLLLDRRLPQLCKEKPPAPSRGLFVSSAFGKALGLIVNMVQPLFQY
jgi:hypothetical protein